MSRFTDHNKRRDPHRSDRKNKRSADSTGQRRSRRNAQVRLNSAEWLAALIVALSGSAIGVASGLLSSYGEQARAELSYKAAHDLRDAPSAPLSQFSSSRPHVISSRYSAGAPERFTERKFQRETSVQSGPPPKIVIIFDDMGLSRPAFDKVMALPGPLTLSFLPYSLDPQPLIDQAKARGDDVLLHLPMEPAGDADPGPNSISADMLDGDLKSKLDWNLDRFSGYIGVNNHMGSKATKDPQLMKAVLSSIQKRGLFFVDSLTTGESSIASAGAEVGALVIARDVFLDPAFGKKTVRRQLALVEKIAHQRGYAIAICHPRSDTIEVIGPWLTSAVTRGFELATISTILETDIVSAEEIAAYRFDGS